MKAEVIERATVRRVTKDEYATDDIQRSIGHYHRCLAEYFGLGDHYSSN